jgi:hypothetical protein
MNGQMDEFVDERKTGRVGRRREGLIDRCMGEEMDSEMVNGLINI